MKKIFYILGFLLIHTLLFGNKVFSNCENSCKIVDAPAPVLSEYIHTLTKLSNNLNSQVSQLKRDTSVKNIYSKAKANIQKGLNQIITWDGYYSLWDFYVLQATTTEFVPEMWRDYNLLKNQEKALKNYYKTLISRGYNNNDIDTNALCNGIENCQFSDKSILIVMSEIVKNHDNIMDYYRLSILGKKKMFEKNILFVPDNFKDEFGIYYNEYTQKNCSECEGGTMDRIKKQFNIISTWQQSAKDGMVEWQEAVSMLNGTYDIRKYEQRERELLKQEMRRQGLSLSQSNTILNNLDRYNENGGYSRDNNFISNSFNHLKDSITSQITDFSDSITQLFKKEDKVATEIFTKVEKNFFEVKNIEETINSLYMEQLDSANHQDTSAQSLEMRMIELHYDLTQAIQNLESTKKISQKVCNDQGQGLGKCN